MSVIFPRCRPGRCAGIRRRDEQRNHRSGWLRSFLRLILDRSGKAPDEHLHVASLQQPWTWSLRSVSPRTTGRPRRQRSRTILAGDANDNTTRPRSRACRPGRRREAGTIPRVARRLRHGPVLGHGPDRAAIHHFVHAVEPRPARAPHRQPTTFTSSDVNIAPSAQPRRDDDGVARHSLVVRASSGWRCRTVPGFGDDRHEQDDEEPSVATHERLRGPLAALDPRITARAPSVMSPKLRRRLRRNLPPTRAAGGRWR